MTKLRNIFIGVFFLVLFTGCMKSSDPIDNCSYDTCEVKAPAAEITSVQNYLTANSITATQHCSGVFYRIETQGTGASPDICSYITVNYEGSLTNGTVFDSNTSTAAPASFYLYQLIDGWKNTLPMLKEGGRIYLYIPPSLGYGPTATASIPANSILIFRLDLINVQ